MARYAYLPDRERPALPGLRSSAKAGAASRTCSGQPPDLKPGWLRPAANRAWSSSYAIRMGDSPLSPQEDRASAAALAELGPEYSDAMVASFVERADQEIAPRTSQG